MINVFQYLDPTDILKIDTHPTLELTSYDITRLCNKNVILQGYIKPF
jgi:hypothetical protein